MEKQILLPLKPYAYPTYTRMEAVVHNARIIAKWINETYDENVTKYLLCRGSSGMSICVALWPLVPNCQIEYIRKDTETEHESNPGSYLVRDMDPNDIVLVIDDFVASGETMEHIMNFWDEICRIANVNRQVDAIIIERGISNILHLADRTKLFITGS